MILNILPYYESFSRGEAGAISLSLNDFNKKSIYSKHTIIVGSKGALEPLSNNFRYLSISKSFFQNPETNYIKRVCRFALSNSIKLIELHNSPNCLNLIRSTINVKLSIFFHNDPHDLKGSKTAQERIKLLQTADSIYCVSSYIKNRFLEGIEGYEHLLQKVHVIYNVCPKPAKIELFNKQKIILFVGRISKEKGIIEFMQSLKYFLPQNPDWKVLVIGAQSNSFFRSKADRLIIDAIKKYPAQVLYKSKSDYENVQEWFGASSIAVVPSKWEEPFGRAALEAINNGCALITSNKGGIPEIIDDTGYVLDKITPHTIANSVLELINNPNTLIEQQNKSLTRALKFAEYDSTKTLDEVRSKILGVENLENVA